MPNESKACKNCVHSIRVGMFKRPSATVTDYTMQSSKLRCTYEPTWRDVAPDHYCGHHKLDITQEFEVSLEKYQSPIVQRMDIDEFLQ